MPSSPMAATPLPATSPPPAPAVAPASFDALLPPEMAAKAEALGVKKATADLAQLSVLGVLAGAFIAFGAIFCTTVLTGSAVLPFGVARLLGGLVFSLGLILVVVGGAELFTGNVLIMMAWARRRVTGAQLFRNWAIVYVGNLAGSIATAAIMFASGQYTLGNGAVGLTAVSVANLKCGLPFGRAVALGVLCNALVCMAVWLCYSARSTTDKILSIVFPISAFVAAGFEHSIANMYFIPIGLFIKAWAPAAFWQSKALVDAHVTLDSLANLSWRGFFVTNLLPVTLGNIIGGAFMVGLVYWFVYLRRKA